MSYFKVHKLNDKGMKEAKIIQALFTDLQEELITVWDDPILTTREMNVTMTKLEEACFYAKKAMAMLPDNQEKCEHD